MLYVPQASSVTKPVFARAVLIAATLVEADAVGAAPLLSAVVEVIAVPTQSNFPVVGLGTIFPHCAHTGAEQKMSISRALIDSSRLLGYPTR